MYSTRKYSFRSILILPTNLTNIATCHKTKDSFDGNIDYFLEIEEFDVQLLILLKFGKLIGFGDSKKKALWC